MLEAITSDPGRPQKHLQRARIVLASAQSGSVNGIATRLGVSQRAVWFWQLRFAKEGVEGILHDKTRKPGKSPIAPEKIDRVLALTCIDPLSGATHWSGRAIAKAVGVSLRSVQRIREAHGAPPALESYDDLHSEVGKVRAIVPSH